MAERLGIVTESRAAEEYATIDFTSCSSEDDVKKLIKDYGIPKYDADVVNADFEKAAASGMLENGGIFGNTETFETKGTVYVVGYEYGSEDGFEYCDFYTKCYNNDENRVNDFYTIRSWFEDDDYDYQMDGHDEHVTYKLFKVKSQSPIISSSPQVASGYTHEHTYDWKVLTDPTIDQDGVYAYMCSCGDIKEKQPISAAQVFVKGLYGKVKEAPQNGTVTYDAKSWSTISDYVLKKMAERNDAAVTIQFNYQKTAYEITFPAGTDYTVVLNDTETMYGFFGIAKILGLNVKAI